MMHLGSRAQGLAPSKGSVNGETFHWLETVPLAQKRFHYSSRKCPEMPVNTQPIGIFRWVGSG